MKKLIRATIEINQNIVTHEFDVTHVKESRRVKEVFHACQRHLGRCYQRNFIANGKKIMWNFKNGHETSMVYIDENEIVGVGYHTCHYKSKDDTA